MFFNFGRTKSSLERDLDESLKLEKRLKEEYEILTDKIEEKVLQYNIKLEGFNLFKADYKNGKRALHKLEENVENYKTQKEQMILEQNADKLRGFVKEANEVLKTKIETPIRIIKMHKNLLEIIKLSSFKNLNRKIEIEFNLIKNLVFNDIYKKITTNSSEVDKIKYLMILLKLEDYFNQPIYIEMIIRSIQTKFNYHFLTNTDTNRIDRPNWFFDFLLKEVYNSQKQLQTYLEQRNDCSLVKINQDILNELYKRCVMEKVKQIEKCNSKQKRNLMLQVLLCENKFNENVSSIFKVDLDNKEIVNKLNNLNLLKIHEELENIHSQNYLHWFKGYREIIKEQNNLNIKNRNVGNVSWTLEMIVFHTEEFISNLSYVDRNEIELLNYFFTELEEFKSFLILETNVNTVDKLTFIQTKIVEITNNLIDDDTNRLLRILGSFMYVTPENKRNFIVKLSEYLDAYKISLRYKEIKEMFMCKIDKYLMENVITKYKMESEEFLDFKIFMKDIKNVFDQEYEWTAECGIKLIEDAFEGNKIEKTSLGKIILNLYL